MILSAHRVVSAEGTVGINCFHYAQPNSAEVAPDERFFLAGKLIWQDRTLRAETRIVSYVDIALPEDVSGEEMAVAFQKLTQLEEAPATYRPRGSRVAFRLSVHSNVLPFWQREVATLVQHLLEAHP